MTVRSRHASLLPAWADLTDAEARKGTAHVRAVDPNLVVALDTRRYVYQVWGPSILEGAWVPLIDVRDDYGRPYRSAVPWHLVVDAVKRGQDPGQSRADIDALVARNEARDRAAEAARDEEQRAGAEYYQRGIAGEHEGWGRWSAEDVAHGWDRARTGAGRVRRGLVVSAPAPAGR